MLPMRFTIGYPPTTKKNSTRVVYVGERCFRCKRGKLPIVKPSLKFEEFERAIAPALQARFAEKYEAREQDCALCDATGKRHGETCQRCAGRRVSAVPFDGLVAVEAAVYREALRGDLSGFHDAIGDLLQTAGVLLNDRQIVAWPVPSDGFQPMRKDADRPRIELLIREPPPPYEVQPALL